MARLRIRELQLGTTLRIQVVESIDIRHWHSQNGGQLSASLEPVAVIVSTASTARAFDMDGDEIDFVDIAR
jgi:hypothetical protein